MSIYSLTPATQAYQQQHDTVNAVDQQAESQDIVGQQQAAQQKFQQQLTEQANLNARTQRQQEQEQRKQQAAQSAQIAAAKRAGVKTEIDATGTEQMQRHEDDTPVYEHGFLGSPQQSPDGQHVVKYRTPRGGIYTVTTKDIRTTQDATGTPLYEFDAKKEDGSTETINHPVGSKPLWNTDPKTGKMYTGAADPETGSYGETQIGVDRKVANQAAIQQQKEAFALQQSERNYKSDETKLLQDQQESVLKPIKETLTKSQKAYDKLAKEKIQYQDTPKGLVKVMDLGGGMEPVKQLIPSTDTAGIASAQAWINQKADAEKALADAKAAHAPVYSQVQTLQQKRDQLALDALRAGHASQVQLKAMEDAHKAGLAVYEPDWQKRVAAARTDPRITNIITQGNLDEQGGPLAEDVRSASLPETSKMLNRVLNAATSQSRADGVEAPSDASTGVPMARPGLNLLNQVMDGLTAGRTTAATAYGYPIKSAKELGIDDYLKAHPEVAGMAWGGGENDSGRDEPRVIVPNEYNQYMSDPVKREGLTKIEAARHKMSEVGFNPGFDITPEQQKWRRGLGAYATNDKAFKQSIVSRLLAHDDVPGVTPQQQAAADEFERKFLPNENYANVKDLITKSLGITNPEKWQVKPSDGMLGELGYHDLITDGEDVGRLNTRDNRIELTPPTEFSNQVAKQQQRLINANKGGLPIYYGGGEPPMTKPQLRDMIQQGVNIAHSTTDPLQVETKLAEAGMSPAGLRQKVMNGQLSVQDGRMLNETFHGVKDVDASTPAVLTAFSQHLATPVAGAQYRNGDLPTKQQVVNQFMDTYAQRAGSNIIPPSRSELAKVRSELLAKADARGTISKGIDGALGLPRDVIAPLAGMIVEAVSVPLWYGPRKLMGYKDPETDIIWNSSRDLYQRQANSSNFVHRMFGQGEMKGLLQDLRKSADHIQSVDDIPDALNQSIRDAAYDGYHQYTDANAKEVNTSRDTFDIKKDPTLRAMFSRYLQNADGGTYDGMLQMLSMSGNDRATQAQTMQYLERPQVATADNVIDRAKLLDMKLDTGRAAQVLEIGKKLDTAKEPAQYKNLIAHAGKVLGLEKPADIQAALSHLTRDETDDPNSWRAQFRAGTVADAGDLGTEVLSDLATGALTASVMGAPAGAALKTAQVGARQALKQALKSPISALKNQATKVIGGSLDGFAERFARASSIRTTLREGLTAAADKYRKLGIVHPTFGAPLTGIQKARNAVVGIAKSAVAAAPIEAIEEGTHAVLEAAPTPENVVDSMIQGALGGTVLVPMFAGANTLNRAWNAGKRDKSITDFKAGIVDKFNSRMAEQPGFNPLTVDDFDTLQGIQDNPAQQSALQDHAASLNELAAAQQEHTAAVLEMQDAAAGNSVSEIPPSPRLLAAQAATQASADHLTGLTSVALSATDELRALPADQRPLYTGIAKATSGAADYTVPEAKALMTLGGQSAVAFQQAQVLPADVSGPAQASTLPGAPTVSQTNLGTYRLLAGVRIQVPQQAIDALHERAPSLRGLISPNAPAMAQTQVAVVNPIPTQQAQSTQVSAVAENRPLYDHADGTHTAAFPSSNTRDAWVDAQGDKIHNVVKVSSGGSHTVRFRRTEAPAPAQQLPPAPTPTVQPAAITPANPAARAAENIARQVIGAVSAKSPKLKSLIKESKEPNPYPTGGFWMRNDGTVAYHIPTIQQQLAGRAPQEIAQQVAALLDEEVRHAANMDAAERLWRQGGTNPLGLDFAQWRDAWYGDIWQNHFTQEMRDKVQEAYGDTLPKQDWMRAMEGLRMLDQLRATGSITESVLRALDAVLTALREFLNLVTAGSKPIVQREIDSIAAVLQEFGYENGAVQPAKAKRKAAKPQTALEKAMAKKAAMEAKGGVTGEWKPVAVDEPVVPKGTVRFYHAGILPIEEGTRRWLSPNRQWVEGFRPGLPVSYVDIPVGDDQLRKSFDDSGTPMSSPFVSFEANGETTAGLQPLANNSQAIQPATTNDTTTNEDQAKRQEENGQGRQEELLNAPTATEPAATPPESGVVAAPSASQASIDKIKSAFDGLASAPIQAPEQQIGLPKERRTAFLDVAESLIADGIQTPAGLAAALITARPDGSLVKYSQALWNFFSTINPELTGQHDWLAIYADAANTPLANSEKKADTPSNDSHSSTLLESNQPDAGTADAGRAGGVQPGRRKNRGNGNRVDEAGATGGDTSRGSPMPADVPAALGGDTGRAIVRQSESRNGERAAGDPVTTGGGNPDEVGVAVEQRGSDEPAEPLVGTSGSTIPLAAGGGDSLAGIKQSAPALTEEQAGDVAFIEQRLDTKPGVLVTNGTGTGKTFTGMGAVKRMLDTGKRHILIAAPSDKVVNDWIATAQKFFGIQDIVQLGSTQDNGTGSRVVVTTYANLGQNDSLANRPWDAVFTDEAHYLSQNKEGNRTAALDSVRALTLHRDGKYRRAEMENPQVVARLAEINTIAAENKGSLSDALDTERSRLWKVLEDAHNAIQAKIDVTPEASRPKVVMLSATPFAYHFSLDYAEGYLYDFPPENQRTVGRYNHASPRSLFYMENFGYRMRTGKLTAPENATATGILERRFAERLMKSGAMSGRALQVDKDYGRHFVLTESELGTKVDEIVSAIQANDYMRPLARFIGIGDYLERRYLLEALKARESIDRIKAHIKMGRKVVVFHDYKKGGATNPLRAELPAGMSVPAMVNGASVNVKLSDALEALRRAVPHYDDTLARLNGLLPPLDLLAREFPEMGIFNGDVPAKKRRDVVDNFNKTGGGMNVVLVQRASGKEGISLHDRDGQHQRVFIDLGIPGRPTDAIQSEGRIYRHGVMSNAIVEYLTTGTSFERHTFAQTIAQRASTAENLAMGERARALLQSFATGYMEAEPMAPSNVQGTGGKAKDAAILNADPFKDAVALYYTNAKKTSRNKAAEGIDYFATPEPLGFKMAEWARIRPGEKVLEPSAGHGAIARFFPDSTNRHAVEPSNELAGKLALNATDVQIHETKFENYNTGNKFDAIVMNPPFGTAGKTAMDHLIKATQHLRNGGRIVALIPEGSSMEKRFDKWMDSPEAAGIYLVAEYGLPTVAFERAGTSVKARVVILDKTDSSTGLRTRSRRDFTGDTPEQFFASIKESSAPERAGVASLEKPAQTEELELASMDRETVFPKPSVAAPNTFVPDETFHVKKGKPTYVAKISRRLSSEEYASAKAIATKHSGYYSKFASNGAIPGFQFDTIEDRDAFLSSAMGDSLASAPARAPTASKQGVNRAATVSAPAEMPLTPERIRATKIIANLNRVQEKRALLPNEQAAYDQASALLVPTTSGSALYSAPAGTPTDLSDAISAIESYAEDPTEVDNWPEDLQEAFADSPMQQGIDNNDFAEFYRGMPESERTPQHQQWNAETERADAGEEVDLDKAEAFLESAKARKMALAPFLPLVKERVQATIQRIEALGRHKWNSKEKTFDELDEPRVLYSAPADPPSPASPSVDAEKQARIREILADMPPTWRNVLQDQWDGKSIEETAQARNLKPEAVRNVLLQASGRFRVLMNNGAAPKVTVKVENGIVKAAGGRPDLSLSGKSAFAAVDQRRATPEEVTHADMQEAAAQMFAADPVAAEKLVTRWMDSGTTVLSTAGMPEGIQRIVDTAQARMAAEMLMTAAAKLLVTEKALQGGSSFETARLIDLYRNTGTEQARALNMRRDPFDTPGERAAMYLSETLLTPPASIRNEMKKNPANKEKILAAWAKQADKIKADMLAAGIDLDATFREMAKEKKLAEATIPDPIKQPLARAAKKTRQLVKAVLEGKSWQEAMEAAGLTLAAARYAYNGFRAELNKIAANAAAQARDEMLRSAPVDFAAGLGLPEWTDAVDLKHTAVKTAATEKLKEQRERKKTGGEIDLKNPLSANRARRLIEERKSNGFDKLSEYWRASILSGPQTHVVNIVSGLTYGTYEATFKKMAAGAQADIARMFGLKPDAASLADIPAMIAAVLPAIKLAFLDSIRSWKSETGLFDSYAIQSLDDNGALSKDSFTPALKGMLGKIMRGISFRLMGAADEFVKSFFTRIEVAAQARQIARSEGKKGVELARAISELMQPGSLAWERSLAQAKRITFQDQEVHGYGKLESPLQPGHAAIDTLDHVASLISRMKKGDFGKLLKGLSHFTFPFVSTPTNIFKAGVTMSPVGGLLAIIDATRSLHRRKQGNVEEAQRIYNAARALDDITNQIVAWGFILGLSALVKPGDDEDELPFITGTIPWRSSSPGEREIAYRTAPPQSIRIGDTWYSYKRLDPFASALSFTIDAIREFQSGKPLDEAWGAVGMGMLTNMQDKTFLQGVSDLVNAVQDPQRFGTKWATNIAIGFVPNLVRQPARTSDSVFRENDLPNDMGFWDVLEHRIGFGLFPAASNPIAPMPAVDIWGRPAAKDTGTGGPNTDWMMRLFSPVEIRDATSPDPLDVALLRYNMTHEDPFGVSAPSRELQKTIGGEPVKISLQDPEYLEFVTTAGQAARTAIGDMYNGRDLTEDDVDAIKKVISKVQAEYRNQAFFAALANKKRMG